MSEADAWRWKQLRLYVELQSLLAQRREHRLDGEQWSHYRSAYRTVLSEMDALAGVEPPAIEGIETE